MSGTFRADRRPFTLSSLKRGRFTLPLLKRGRFTLIELLVVITIIILLVGMLLPALGQARAYARKSSCLTQLNQLGLGQAMYRDDNDDAMPFWLSIMYPDYISDKRLFICPQDQSAGHDGSRSGGQSTDGTDDMVQELIAPGCLHEWEETDDTEFNNAAVPNLPRNTDITRCSYMYEWAGAICTWDSSLGADATWWDVKTNELRNGSAKRYDNESDPCYPGISTGKPWDHHLFPSIRCYWHWTVLWGKSELVLNTAYEGSTFLSRLCWEKGIH